MVACVAFCKVSPCGCTHERVCGIGSCSKSPFVLKVHSTLFYRRWARVGAITWTPLSRSVFVSLLFLPKGGVAREDKCVDVAVPGWVGNPETGVPQIVGLKSGSTHSRHFGTNEKCAEAPPFQLWVFQSTFESLSLYKYEYEYKSYFGNDGNRVAKIFQFVQEGDESPHTETCFLKVYLRKVLRIFQCVGFAKLPQFAIVATLYL